MLAKSEYFNASTTHLIIRWHIFYFAPSSSFSFSSSSSSSPFASQVLLCISHSFQFSLKLCDLHLAPVPNTGQLSLQSLYRGVGVSGRGRGLVQGLLLQGGYLFFVRYLIGER